MVLQKKALEEAVPDLHVPATEARGSLASLRSITARREVPAHEVTGHNTSMTACSKERAYRNSAGRAMPTGSESARPNESEEYGVHATDAGVALSYNDGRECGR